MMKGTTLESVLETCSAMPLKGVNFSDFYVNTYEARGNNPVQKMRLNLGHSLNPYQKILFLGHTGSGKSTELYLLEDAIKDQYEIISFCIQEVVDSIDLYYTDFIFAIMSKIISYVENQENINLEQESIDGLYEYWFKEQIIETTDYEEREMSAGFEAKLSFLKKISIAGKGILKSGAEKKKTTREKLEPKLTYLIQLMNQLIGEINRQLKARGNKELLVIVEDLDKLDYKQAEGIFVLNRQAVLALQVKMVLTCPIYMVYDKQYHMMKDDFDDYQLLNMIKVTDMNKGIYKKGIDTMQEIVSKRVELSLFEEETLQFMIRKSGGVLRDLFQMIRSAAVEALCRERSAISMEDVAVAYRELKSEYSRSIRTREDIVRLKEIYHDPKPSCTDEIMESLLLRGLVLEYNGERWCGIHPVVKDFLEEKGEL